MASEKKALAVVAENLRAGEAVAASIQAVTIVSNSISTNPVGQLIATNERLIFSGSVAFKVEFHAHELSDIASIEFERGLIQSVIRVTVADGESTQNLTYRVEPRHAPKFVEVAQRAIDVLAEAAAHETKAASIADELAKLADLHDRGVLDDDEFAAAKAKVLS